MDGKNLMELWLEKYGTVDKDAEADSYKESSRLRSTEYVKKMKADAVIDLHGYTRDEAWKALTGFVNDCVRKGLKKILIIHGKGIHSSSADPVLGQMVRTFIEQNSHMGTSGHPDRTLGGSGATWVMIK